MQFGRIDEAMTYYQKALDNNPTFVDVRYNYANGWMQLGKPLIAIEQYRKILEFQPDDIQAFKRLFDAYLQTGQRDEALKVAQSALEIAQVTGKKEAARKIAGAIQKIRHGRPK